MPISDESLPPGGQMLRQAFEALVATLNERGVRYAIIGGLAIGFGVRAHLAIRVDWANS